MSSTISSRVAAPSNPGAIEGGNSDLTYAQRVETYLEIFTGSVLMFREEYSLMRKHTTIETITEGQSARIDALGKTTGQHMKAGDRLGGGGINHNKVLVELDPMFVAHVSIFWQDEAQLHFEAIPKYAMKCAEAVANYDDLNILLNVVLSSKKSTPVVSDYPNRIGTELTYTAAGDENDVAKIKAQLVDALSVQKSKGYKPSDLTVICGTTMLNRLRQDDDFVSVDKGASGNIKDGNANMFMGLVFEEDIFWDDKTVNHTGTADGTNKYDVDLTNLHFIVVAKDATVTLDLGSFTPFVFDEDAEFSTYLGTHSRSGYAVLNPAGAVSVWKASV